MTLPAVRSAAVGTTYSSHGVHLSPTPHTHNTLRWVSIARSQKGWRWWLGSSHTLTTISQRDSSHPRHCKHHLGGQRLVNTDSLHFISCFFSLRRRPHRSSSGSTSQKQGEEDGRSHAVQTPFSSGADLYGCLPPQVSFTPDLNHLSFKVNMKSKINGLFLHS